MKDVMTLQEVSDEISIASPTLRRMIDEGHLEATLLPGSAGYRLTREQVQAWVSAGFPGFALPAGSRKRSFVDDIVKKDGAP